MSEIFENEYAVHLTLYFFVKKKIYMFLKKLIPKVIKINVASYKVCMME